MKLTPWFSGDQKPVRVGVYQRHYINHKGYIELRYCWWNGYGFCTSWKSPDSAERNKDMGLSLEQQMPWRGVMK